MYRQIIDTLNQFLNYIHIPGTPLNPDAFQGILVKKLSNQNIIKDKRRINAGDTSSTVNQTHIDVTGKQGMLFFFEELNNATTSVQSIDIAITISGTFAKSTSPLAGQTQTETLTMYVPISICHNT